MEGHKENLNKHPVLGRKYSSSERCHFPKSIYKFKAVSMNPPCNFSFWQWKSRYLVNLCYKHLEMLDKI